MPTFTSVDTGFTSSTDFAAQLAKPKSPGWLRGWQLTGLAFPLVALAVFALASWYQQPDYTSLLWNNPLGARMLGATAAQLGVGVALYLAGCLAINLVVARSTWGTGATSLQVVLVVAWLVLFCMPAAYMVLLGPSAVQIQQQMLTP